MKKVLTVLFLTIFFVGNSKAAKYLMIKHPLFGRTQLKFVPEPSKLNGWYYNNKGDIYLKEKNAFGIPMKIKGGKIKKIKL